MNKKTTAFLILGVGAGIWLDDHYGLTVGGQGQWLANLDAKLPSPLSIGLVLMGVGAFLAFKKGA